MKKVNYRELVEIGRSYWGFLAIVGFFILLGLGAAYYMESNGHHVTGMSNQVVWGTPHVFAVFLIVAASGILNVASIGSVFRKGPYKPLARMSGLFAIALLVGGLAVLVLDLGRPDRLIVAMTHYNFKSIFAWNIFLYTGFMVIVAIYLWTMMDPVVNRFKAYAGFFAFLWRLILTTGTGLIFGFLISRDAYGTAIMAPMFIASSFSFGMAIFLLALFAIMRSTGRPLGDVLVRRLKNVLGIFIGGAFYFVVAYHLMNLYATSHHDVERFILLDGGVYTRIFWIGQILLGTFVPLAMLYHPTLGRSRGAIATASVLVVLGGLAQMYVIIIGGQVFPIPLFRGMEVSSSFFDGVVAHYAPSLPEVLLGFSGMALAVALSVVAMRVLRFVPESLADEVVDPHAAAAVAAETAGEEETGAAEAA